VGIFVPLCVLPYKIIVVECLVKHSNIFLRPYKQVTLLYSSARGPEITLRLFNTHKSTQSSAVYCANNN
jgi:hypothetical protein